MGHRLGMFDAGLDRDHFDRKRADIDSYVGHGGSVQRNTKAKTTLAVEDWRLIDASLLAKELYSASGENESSIPKSKNN
jgi:hypothetical protein